MLHNEDEHAKYNKNKVRDRGDRNRRIWYDKNASTCRIYEDIR